MLHHHQSNSKCVTSSSQFPERLRQSLPPNHSQWRGHCNKSPSTALPGLSGHGHPEPNTHPKGFFSSCWVIINSQVYDVTEFLPVGPLSTTCQATGPGTSNPDCRNTLAAHKSFSSTLGVMQPPPTSPFTLRTLSTRISQLANTWVRLTLMPCVL